MLPHATMIVVRKKGYALKQIPLQPQLLKLTNVLQRVRIMYQLVLKTTIVLQGNAVKNMNAQNVMIVEQSSSLLSFV